MTTLEDKQATKMIVVVVILLGGGLFWGGGVSTVSGLQPELP